MPKKNIALLKRLRTRFLRMRHPKHFDMSTIAIKTECGTAMCIAGHALDLQGYKFKQVPCSLGCCMNAVLFSPKGRRVEGELDRAAREMGIDSAVAQDLFYDYSLKTPKQAAARIERLIAEAEGA
jgi:hypothetical protein